MTKKEAPYRGIVSCMLGFLAIGLFMTSVHIVRSMLPKNESWSFAYDQGIDSGALLYTDSPEALQANQRLIRKSIWQSEVTFDTEHTQ